MKTSPLALSSLTFGLSFFLISCDQNEKTDGQEPATPTTTELAREAEFSPWMSRAELQVISERLSDNESFSSVEGRLSDKGNQYRAIIASSDQDPSSSSRSLWGLSAAELYVQELILLRLGFVRSESQVFTDSTGQAIHQLVMVLPWDSEVTKTSGEVPEKAPENVELPVMDPGAIVDPNAALVDSGPESPTSGDVDPESVSDQEAVDVTEDTTSESKVDVPTKPLVWESEDPEVTEIAPGDDGLEDSGAGSAGLGEVLGEIETPDSPENGEPGVAIIVDDPEAEEMAEEPETGKNEPEGEPEVTEPTPTPPASTYKVVKGDTLSEISRKFKVSVLAIKQANGLRSDLLRINQVLKIPAKR